MLAKHLHQPVFTLRPAVADLQIRCQGPTVVADVYLLCTYNSSGPGRCIGWSIFAYKRMYMNTRCPMCTDVK